jgi:hypothetical protein
MDAAKSQALDSTVRLVFSLAHGILLVFCLAFLYILRGETQLPSLLFVIGVLAAVSYVLGFLLNLLIQYIGCSKLNVGQIAFNSLFGPLVSSLTFILITFVPGLTSVVSGVLPLSVSPLYQKIVSEGFFIFWAGLYAQVFASGFVQVCPS